MTSFSIITFQKDFINLKSTQNITHKCPGLDVKQISLYTCKSRNMVIKFYKKIYIFISTDLSNAINKMSNKISFHRHFTLKDRIFLELTLPVLTVKSTAHESIGFFTTSNNNTNLSSKGQRLYSSSNCHYIHKYMIVIP